MHLQSPHLWCNPYRSVGCSWVVKACCLTWLAALHTTVHLQGSQMCAKGGSSMDRSQWIGQEALPLSSSSAASRKEHVAIVEACIANWTQHTPSRSWSPAEEQTQAPACKLVLSCSPAVHGVFISGGVHLSCWCSYCRQEQGPGSNTWLRCKAAPQLVSPVATIAADAK